VIRIVRKFYVRLLSLPSGVDTLLLQFISSGEQSLQLVFNLRKVCKTTKSRVEHLQAQQGPQVFSNACVVKDIGEVNTN